MLCKLSVGFVDVDSGGKVNIFLTRDSDSEV